MYAYDNWSDKILKVLITGYINALLYLRTFTVLFIKMRLET